MSSTLVVFFSFILFQLLPPVFFLAMFFIYFSAVYGFTVVMSFVEGFSHQFLK